MPQKTKKNRRGRTRKTQGGDPNRFPLTRPPRSSPFSFPGPAERDVELSFNVSFVLTNTGQTFAAAEFLANSAYPDVVTPTNLPNGFSYEANLYGSYRVIAYSYEFQILSRETFGFDVLIRNTNTAPGSGSGQLAFNGEALSYVKKVAAPPVPAVWITPADITGRRGKKWINVAEVTGRNIEFDDIVAADIANSPSDLVHLQIYIQALTETFTAATGAAVNLRLTQKYRFFNRRLVNDTTPAPKMIPYVQDGGKRDRRFDTESS